MNKQIHVIGILFLIAIIVSCKSAKPVIEFESNSIGLATEQNEVKKYILKKRTRNSDFNYRKINKIDRTIRNSKDGVTNENLLRIFNPVKGKYNYYQFIATFKGLTHREKYEDIHDILIIKTDSKGIIKDAYQYTLEWAEPPLQYDLFKCDTSNLFLNKNLSVELLKLKRKNYWDKKNILHNENGRILIE